MSAIVALIILVAVILTLAYQQAPLWLWTVGGFVTLWFVGRFAAGPISILLVLLWVLWIVLLLLNVTALRQRFISMPLLKIFRSVLPKLSQTEQEALDAGTVWWDAELFSGRPQWHR